MTRSPRSMKPDGRIRFTPARHMSVRSTSSASVHGFHPPSRAGYQVTSSCKSSRRASRLPLRARSYTSWTVSVLLANEWERLHDAARVATRVDRLGDGNDRARRLCIRLLRHDLLAGVPLLAQNGIERNRPDQRDAEL